MSAKPMMLLEGSIVTAVIECVLVGFTRFKGYMICHVYMRVMDWIGLLGWVGWVISVVLCGLKNCDCGDSELLGVVIYSFREIMTWKDICTFFPILHSYSIKSIILFLTLIATVEC